MASPDPMKRIEEVRETSAITYGLMATKALFAALDFDLFTRIETGSSSRCDVGRGNGDP